MFRIMKTEIWKLKRYHMIWAGVLLMLLSVLLTVFSTTASDDTVWTFPFFAEQVIKNNVTMIFPMCIALLAGYIIAREGKDDTLKNIVTIPVSYRNLLCGKLLACALLSLFLGLVSAVFTIIANLLMGFPGLSAISVLQAFTQIILNCLFLYIAVMPVIAATARVANGHLIGTIVAFFYGYSGMFAAADRTVASLYPVTASLGLIRYRSYDPAVHWNGIICLFSILTAFFIAAICVFTAKTSAPVKTNRKQKQVISKKGW